MAYVVRGKSGKVVGRYATRGEAEARIAQLRAGAQRLQRYQFSPGDDFKRGRGTKRAPGGRGRTLEFGERLFAGVYSTGISYADREHEEHGDYKKVAFLSFRDLKLTVYDPKSPLLRQVKADAAKIQARHGELFPIDASGHTVRLGGGAGSPKGGRSVQYVTRPAAPRVPEGWIEEIRNMLDKAGYAGDLQKHAERLVREGYGPEEIAHRIKTEQIEHNLGIQMVKRGYFKMSPTRTAGRTPPVGPSTARRVLGDARYEERHRFRGWNIQPTVLQEPRLFPRVFPELTRADHARLATSFGEKAVRVQAQHHKWVARGEGLYGRNGGVISGGFHDDWPASVKETIRRLAHGYTKLRDAAVAHLKASRLRGIQ